MLGLDGIMRKAQEMQTQMGKIQEELAARTVTASSGGGMVTVTCSGKQEIKAIAIDPAVVNPDDMQLLQDLVLTAVNEAIRQSQEMAAKEMSALAGGLNIPGLDALRGTHG